jgi:hypothetical protein
MKYIRKLTRIGSAGPTEERNFAIYVGYDLDGVSGELPGFLCVENWSEAQLAEYGVTRFRLVEPRDRDTYAKLGITPDVP